jgi:hypothetical protein
MNLLDKYILEIGKHISRRNRPDLLAEIRSTIEDMLIGKALTNVRAFVVQK